MDALSTVSIKPGQQQPDAVLSRIAALASLLNECEKQYQGLARRLQGAREASKANLRAVQLQKHHMHQQAMSLMHASQYASAAMEEPE